MIYSEKTFSPARYEIWVNRSEFHNLPTLNEFSQKEGKEFRAEHCVVTDKEEGFDISMELQHAWEDKCGIKKYLRKFSMLQKTETLTISEVFTFNERIDKEKNKITFTFMLAEKPIFENGNVTLYSSEGPAFLLTYEDLNLKASFEEIKLTDKDLMSSWGETIYRLLFSVEIHECDYKTNFHIKPLKISNS